jgi:hypothetical protein
VLAKDGGSKVYLLTGQSCYYDYTVEGVFSSEEAALEEKRKLDAEEDYNEDYYAHRPTYEVRPKALRDK